MADKVVLTDINKLNPELAKLSKNELERRLNEIQMALKFQEEESARKEREAKLAEAVKHYDAVMDGLRWLKDNGFLSDKVVETYTNAKGVFTPHLSIRRPSA